MRRNQWTSGPSQASGLHDAYHHDQSRDLGGTDGFVRVTYHDTDFVDYAIPRNTTVQISLAGGGTPGTDDVIKVTSTGGALLIGQASLITGASAKPHPLLGGKAFCTTTAMGGTSPF